MIIKCGCRVNLPLRPYVPGLCEMRVMVFAAPSHSSAWHTRGRGAIKLPPRTYIASTFHFRNVVPIPPEDRISIYTQRLCVSRERVYIRLCVLRAVCALRHTEYFCNLFWQRTFDFAELYRDLFNCESLKRKCPENRDNYKENLIGFIFLRECLLYIYVCMYFFVCIF